MPPVPRIQLERTEIEQTIEAIQAGHAVGIIAHRAGAMLRELQQRGIRTRTQTLNGFTYISAIKAG